MSAGDSRLSLAAAGAHRNILLKPVPAMLRLLQSVGVEGDTFTWEQAHHYVGQYIKRRQLYDVERPYLVRCGGDPLGEVFGVEGFSLRDPRHSVAALFVKSFSIVTADSRRAGANVTTTSTTSSPSCAPTGGGAVGRWCGKANPSSEGPPCGI
ncbi:E3 ubiquitin-protein ligase Mdm2-like [Petromyzon marinus]|uniref:E3 ubiquitin-protein ligase Mdm2-like n=1 Tax=Petromyzon marinus TaxID=7757 RepID=UPI003F718275